MKIAIWKTGHQIADTVADALKEGLPDAEIINISDLGNTPNDRYELSIAYGILRRTTEVFNGSNIWFNVDRGYINPSHYDGYYRVSLRGTQTTFFDDWMYDDKRLKRLDISFKPWRGMDMAKPVLIIPPTEHVRDFFHFTGMDYDRNYKDQKCEVRLKGNSKPINFYDYNYVITFNSSVGWQAIQAGIPCVSNSTYSIVGSFCHNISLDNLSEFQHANRHKLFCAMANTQLKLDEIRKGDIWPLMNKLMCSSATMRGKQLAVTLRPTP